MKSGLLVFILLVGFSPVYSLENVALGKPAAQSGDHGLQYTADKAVDGDTNPNADTGKSCAIPDTRHINTRDKDGPAWWRVDLGQEFDVYQVKIYNRDQPAHLRNTWVLVSNQERPDITDENICNEITDGSAAVINVPCNYKNQEVRRGRYVQFWRKSKVANPVYLGLCEVEVYSCPAGFWGMNLPEGLADCVRKCPGSCQNGGTCRVSDGSCPSGCADGFWGKSCDQKCHCAGAASCDVITGSCGAARCEVSYIADKDGKCVTEEKKEASKEEISSNTGLVAGMAVLGVLMLVVIVCLVVLAVLVVILFKRNNNPIKDEETSSKVRRSNPAVLPTAGNNQGFQKEMDEYEELRD